MHLLYDSANVFMNSSSTSFSFYGIESSSSWNCAKPGFYNVDASEAAWQILRLLAMNAHPRPAMLMSMPVCDHYRTSSSDESKYCSDDEYENVGTTKSRSTCTKDVPTKDLEEEEDNMLPSILGGILMITAVAMDMVGII